MTAVSGNFCTHCRLPLGLRPMQRTLDGETCSFCCYGCCIAFQVKSGRNEEFEATWLLIRLGVGGFLSMNVMLISLVVYAGAFDADPWLIPWINLLLWIFATPALVILGEPHLRETLVSARQGRITSSALVVIGVAAAYAYSAFATMGGSQHVYFDTATMVLMLFTLGSFIEASGRAKAARDLEPLLAAESESATVVEDGIEMHRPVREIGPGMLIRVRPGERVPVDGMVVEGQSHTDEAVITGESRRVVKGIGSAMIAGSVNLDGPLLIKSEGAGNATRWAKICRSVREALSRPSQLQRVADRVVGISVPFVLALGGLTTVLWARSLPFDQALLVGLAVLVVACPCAVGLAAPLATSLGIGLLARRGCLVREPAALEALARCRLLAFDKTGTLTSGNPRIVGIDVEGAESDEVLARAAGLERHSEHGYGRAILMAANLRGVAPAVVRDVSAVPGRGLRGIMAGETVAAGNAAFMRDLGWQPGSGLSQRAGRLEVSAHSLVYVGWAGRVHAVLALDDTPLPEARSTIEQLRGLGLRVAILTGDLEQAAHRVGAAVGVADVVAGVTPEGKRDALDRLRQTYPVVAMVGDGLNDGPVLADADIGIAVGSATDLARETAAIVLPSGGLWLLPWVVSVARMVRRTIITNLMWAFGYNFVALTLAALGVLQPILAAGIMASSSLLLVVNSLRLSRFPGPISVRTRTSGAEPVGARRGLAVSAMNRSAVERG